MIVLLSKCHNIGLILYVKQSILWINAMLCVSSIKWFVMLQWHPKPPQNWCKLIECVCNYLAYTLWNTSKSAGCWLDYFMPYVKNWPSIPSHCPYLLLYYYTCRGNKDKSEEDKQIE